MNFTKEQLNTIQNATRKVLKESGWVSVIEASDLAEKVKESLAPDQAVESLLLSGYSGRSTSIGTVWLERQAAEAIVSLVDGIRGRK